MKPLIIGLCFTFLLSSASIATKFGIRSAEPLIIASIRFLVAGTLLIIYCYLLNYKKYEFPQGKDWQKLTTLVFLNTTLYLGCFFTALQTVSAGLASLFVATNPLIITILSAVWLKRKVNLKEWIGIFLATAAEEVVATREPE